MTDRSADGERRSWQYTLAVAASWALMASAAEFAVHLAGRYAFGKPMYQGIDSVWAKPLVNLLLFLPPALLMRRLPSRVFIGFLAFLAMAAPLLLLRPGSPVPMLILAAGMGTQLGLVLGSVRRQAWTVRLGRWLAASFALAAIATQSTRLLAERDRFPVETPAGSPNVLLIILDTVRAASLSLYGGRASTPTLDSLAAAGVTFDRAVSVAPWTLPSHATLFTGLWPYEHGADWRVPLDGRAPTIAEVLSRRGYRTAGFAANLVFTSREHGLQRGFQVYRDYRRSPGALLRSASLAQTLTTSNQVRRLTGFREVAGRKRAVHLNREFLSWEARSGGRPWFAFLNYFDAHEPYYPRAPYAGIYSSGLPPRRFDVQRFWHVEGGIADWKSLSPPEVAAELAAYEEAITGLDADIGTMLAELRRRGSLDRTLVIVTSDHGELFGEHDTFAHGNSIYWRSLHVPLLISWPSRVRSGLRVAKPVSLRDLPATILGLVLPEAPLALPGNSLLLDGDSKPPGSLALSELSTEEFSASDPPMRNGALQSLAGSGWQYTRAANGHEDVYWTSESAARADTLITVLSVRAAIIDSARARLNAAGIPAPRDSSR